LSEQAGPTGPLMLEVSTTCEYIAGAMNTMIQELRERVAGPMRRRGVVRAGVFGSVARGESGEGSDIDFLVEFERGRSLLDLAGLRLELQDLLNREVDVATPNSLHPKLRARILADLIPLL
jgi:uncharacterized protein